MNWFSGTLKIWLTGNNDMFEPSISHHGISLDAAQKLMDKYDPVDVESAMYFPVAISMQTNREVR